jgi:hypothetical protein
MDLGSRGQKGTGSRIRNTAQKFYIIKKQPNKARPKIFSCCDEIMLRGEITGLDST